MASRTDDTNAITKKIPAVMVVVVLGVAVGYYLSGSSPPDSAPAGPAGLDVAGITSVAVDARDNLYLGSASGIKAFSPEHTLIREWKTPGKVVGLAVDEQGNVYAAYTTQIEKFDPAGKPLLRWGRGGCEGDRFKLVSGIAVSGDNVFVADSGEKLVYRFRTDGRYRNAIGAKKNDPEGQGLILPSPFLDCAARDGVLILNHTGKQRIEHYDFEGRQLKVWGKAGTKDDEFPGCCNPSNVTFVDAGRIATAEKGTPRVKVFDTNGKLLTILGQGAFAPECRGIDLAADSKGRIYAVDPVAGCVRVFEAGRQ